MQFKKWLEEQNPASAGLEQQNKAALKSIGDEVGKAVSQGRDPTVAASQASVDAASKIANNATQGGSIVDVAKAAEAAKVLQQGNNASMMKKKMKKMKKKMKK